MRRILPWLYTALILAFGAGFLAAAAVQSSAADAYRSATECPDTSSARCFQLSPGTISSVSVSQTRSGEEDTAAIDTRGSSVTVVLRPSGSEAPHVRTGAAVTVKWYQGRVTLIEVDGVGVQALDNPAAQQSDYLFYGAALMGVGALSALLPLWARRRRSRLEAAMAQTDQQPLGLQETLLPAGGSGWIMRPALKGQVLFSLGFAAVLIVLFTVPRVLGDQTRTVLAIGLDVAIIGLGGLALALFLRNSRLVADRQQVTRVNWLGRSTSYPVSTILHVDRFRTPQNLYAVFAGQDGRELFRIAGRYWDFDQVDRICEAVGLRVTGGYDEMVGARKVNARAKARGNNWTAVALMVSAVVAVTIVLVVLQMGPSSR